MSVEGASQGPPQAAAMCVLELSLTIAQTPIFSNARNPPGAARGCPEPPLAARRPEARYKP